MGKSLNFLFTDSDLICINICDIFWLIGWKMTEYRLIL